MLEFEKKIVVPPEMKFKKYKEITTQIKEQIEWNENLKKVNPQNFQAFLKNSQSVLYQEFLKSSKVKKSSVP